MPNYFADLHIHIGQAQNKPVKITASKSLTITNLLQHSKWVKGLDIVGVVDCASPPVINELQTLINTGDLNPIPNGGLMYKSELLLILGCEVEVKVGNGRAHFICFFPGFEELLYFSKWLSCHLTNVSLSSQLLDSNLSSLINQVLQLQGLIIPAHAFTPFKSLLGTCISSLSEVAEQQFKFSALELGLSADKYLFDLIEDTQKIVTLTNSDAHSLPKIGREYNQLTLDNKDFDSVKTALTSENSDIVNYGLHPQLGKYYRSFCDNCHSSADKYDPPVFTCPVCHSHKIVTGVLDRIVWLANDKGIVYDEHPRGKYYDYIYQVPLADLPGIGEKTYWKLIKHFGTEIDILHRVPKNQLGQIISEKIVNLILQSREGKLRFNAGGGGYYGRVIL